VDTSLYDVLFVWGRIPLVVKLPYTLFVCVLVPKYWSAYGPTNFLYFCDVALIITLPALWLESPLLASSSAIGIVLVQVLWQIDFIVGLFGRQFIGLTDYMFDPKKSLYLRGLSSFHFWLPLLLLYAVWQLGYDPGGLAAWTLLSTHLLLVCYFLMPAPPPPEDNPHLPVNINYVFGLSDNRPQTWMPPLAWLALLLVGMPLCLYWPTHLALQRLFPAPANGRSLL
jgi:hypothetical protein